MIHPLLNPESSGYYDRGEKSAIEQLEEEATVVEQKGWCKGNIFKYAHRGALKGESQKDAKKLETYEAYLTLLQGLPATTAFMICKDAYRMHGITIEYG